MMPHLQVVLNHNLDSKISVYLIRLQNISMPKKPKAYHLQVWCFRHCFIGPFFLFYKRRFLETHSRVCLQNIHRAENASFETCLSRLFRAISPIIPRKRVLIQNPKSAIFISGNVFQTHSSGRLAATQRSRRFIFLFFQSFNFGI